MELELMVPRNERLDPVLVLTGGMAGEAALLRRGEVDLEIVEDGKGGLRLQVHLVDRGHVIARSDVLDPALVEALTGLSLRGRPLGLRLGRAPGGERLDGRLGWRRVDAGPWLACRRALVGNDPSAAVSAAREALARHGDEAGWRALLADCLVRDGKDDEARALYEEEGAAFPGTAHRALAGLALLAWRGGRPDEADALLRRALAIHGDHLRSLLLLAELLLGRGREEEARPLLTRAWELCGATRAELVVSLLERREAEGLLPLLRGEGAEPSPTQAPVPAPSPSPGGDFTEKGDVGKKHEETESAGEPPRGGLGPDEGTDPVVLPVSEVTARDVLLLAVEDMLADGKVDEGERVLFASLAKRFPLPRAEVQALLAEGTRLVREKGTREGVFEAPSFFAKLLRRIYEDGRVSGDESKLVLDVARCLGLSAGECRRIHEAVRAETVGTGSSA